MIQIELSGGTERRLKKIMELRNCSAQEAMEYAVSMGWLMAEKRADQLRKVRK